MGGKQVVRWRTLKHEALVAASLCKPMGKNPEQQRMLKNATGAQKMPGKILGHC